MGGRRTARAVVLTWELLAEEKDQRTMWVDCEDKNRQEQGTGPGKLTSVLSAGLNGSSCFARVPCCRLTQSGFRVSLFFCSSVRRRIIMPRKGWRAVERPAGWYEEIREPRPPSVQWPRATQGFSSVSVNLSILRTIRGAAFQLLRLKNKLRGKVLENRR